MSEKDYATHEVEAVERLYDAYGYDGVLELLVIAIRKSARKENGQTASALRGVANAINRLRRSPVIG